MVNYGCGGGCSGVFFQADYFSRQDRQERQVINKLTSWPGLKSHIIMCFVDQLNDKPSGISGQLNLPLASLGTDTWTVTPGKLYLISPGSPGTPRNLKKIFMETFNKKNDSVPRKSIPVDGGQAFAEIVFKRKSSGSIFFKYYFFLGVLGDLGERKIVINKNEREIFWFLYIFS